MSMFHLNCMNRVFHSGAVSDTIEASGGMDMQIRLAENIRALRRQHRFTQEQPDGVQIAPLMRQLRLEDVRFSYDGETEILRGVSAVFDAGKAYAIVGASGSGKSTLLNLLTTPGMAYAGKILLDGTELRTVSPESLYETMSCPCPALRASSSRTRWSRRRCAAMTAFSF